MSDVVYELATRFTADTSPLFQKMNQLQPQLVGRMGAMGSAAGAAFSSAFTIGATAGLAALAGGILGGGVLAKFTTKAASDAEEAGSKFAFVFGKAASTTTATLDEFAKTAGRSRFELRELAASIGAILGPMGLAEAKTGEMSSKLTILASDLASFFNATDSDALAALQSAIIGEAEPMRKFGVTLNEDKIKAEALASGLMRGKEALTSAAKAQAIYNIILRETKTASGDAIRTADSLANQQRGLAGDFKDSSVALGRFFLPSATELTKFLRTGFNFGPSSDSLEKWGKTLGTVTRNVLQHVGSMRDKLVSFFSAGVNSAIETATGGWAKSFSEFVTKSLDAAVTLTQDINKTWETMKAGGAYAFYSILSSGLSALQQLRAAAEGVVGGMGRVFSAGFDAIRSGMETFGVDVASVFSGIGSNIDILIDHAIARFKEFAGITGAVLNELGRGMALGELKKRQPTLAEKMDAGFKAGKQAVTGTAENQAQAAKSKSMLESIAGNFASGFKDSFAASLNRKDALTNGIDSANKAASTAKGNLFSGIAGMMAARDAKNKPAPEFGMAIAPSLSQIVKDSTAGIFGKIGEGIAGVSGAAGGLLGKGAAMTGKGLGAVANAEQKPFRFEYSGIEEYSKKIQQSLGQESKTEKRAEDMAKSLIEMVKLSGQQVAKSITMIDVLKSLNMGYAP